MDKKKEEKISIPLRMTPELYKKVSDFVHSQKNNNRGYSINKFVVEAINEKMKKESKQYE